MVRIQQGQIEEAECRVAQAQAQTKILATPKSVGSMARPSAPEGAAKAVMTRRTAPPKPKNTTNNPLQRTVCSYLPPHAYTLILHLHRQPPFVRKKGVQPAKRWRPRGLSSPRRPTPTPHQQSRGHRPALVVDLIKRRYLPGKSEPNGCLVNHFY
jgi:hypothetical protein